MTIKVGDRLPDAKLRVMKDGKPADITTGELTKGKKVALFALPGAFTPTCSVKHLPGYKEKAAELRSKGVDAGLPTAPVVAPNRSVAGQPPGVRRSLA